MNVDPNFVGPRQAAEGFFKKKAAGMEQNF